MEHDYLPHANAFGNEIIGLQVTKYGALFVSK